MVVTERQLQEMEAWFEEAAVAAFAGLIAEVRRLKADRVASKAVLTEAFRVLRQVEWGGYGCRVCNRPMREGHASDCALAAVLAQEEPS